MKQETVVDRGQLLSLFVVNRWAVYLDVDSFVHFSFFPQAKPGLLAGKSVHCDRVSKLDPK